MIKAHSFSGYVALILVSIATAGYGQPAAGERGGNNAQVQQQAQAQSDAALPKFNRYLNLARACRSF